MLSIYSIPPLLGAIFTIFIGLFVFLKNKKSELNISFSLFCLSLFIWLFGYTVSYSIKDDKLAMLLCRLSCTGAMFIAPTFYQFTVSYLRKREEKILVWLSYAVMILIVPFSMTSPYFLSGTYKYFWGFYSKAGMLHPVYLVIFFGILIRGFFLLYHQYKKKLQLSSMEANQVRYVFLASLILLVGAIDYVPKYGVQFYPFGFIFVIMFAITIAYTIIRYRLMDIKLAITKTGVFVSIYTIVLGLPFWITAVYSELFIKTLGRYWWIAPLGLMAILATVGPFIYIFIERKAEERLLKNQKTYQQTLKQASVGMTRIRDFRRLLDLITHIVTSTVKISYIGIYLYDEGTEEGAGKYLLQASRDKGRISFPEVNSDAALILWIKKTRQPLVYEEVKRKKQEIKEDIYTKLEEEMRLLTASVVIPSFLEDKLTGFFVLGDKNSGDIYTTDDLSVFQVLASQAALAIENARFYEETKKMYEQVSQAEKMATIGTMADGLSHQINNRFHAISLITADTIDTINITDTSSCSNEIKELFKQVNYALKRIETNVIHGGQVVSGILKYTRKGEKGLEDLTLDQVIDATLEMVQYKVKLSEIDIVRDYTKDAPKIKGNLVQLQEVFFNFIDNAYDAIKERRDLLKEEGYRGRITVSARPKGDPVLEVTVEDNGIGVRNEDIKKIFTPFFTTKISSRKGTGLGLYVIKRIITDNHKGRINFESDYKIGTRFIIELPIAE